MSESIPPTEAELVKEHLATKRFNSVSYRLSELTGSPGLTSWYDGKVHMTIDEYDRVISLLENAEGRVTMAAAVLDKTSPAYGNGSYRRITE